MKAVRIHEYGGPEVLRYEDAPPPVAGADEVLVRVRAASINPIDVGMREGVMARIFPLRLPLTLGQDFAGVIEKAGANAGGLQPGQDVFGATRIETAGAHAEYVVAPRAFVAVKPAGVS